MALISEQLLAGRTGDDDGDAFQLLLYSLALGLKAQLIYEIGVGQSTLAFLRAAQRTGGRVVSCDINLAMRDFISARASEACDLWTFHNVNSELMRAVIHEPAELVFIDGCHSQSCVELEASHYWDLVKEDGLMILHDTRSWPDGPGTVWRNRLLNGYEACEFPMCHGFGILHKQRMK